MFETPKNLSFSDVALGSLGGAIAQTMIEDAASGWNYIGGVAPLVSALLIVSILRVILQGHTRGE